MIRTKDKVLAEPNDPNTILSTKSLTAGSIVAGDGNKAIKSFEPSTNRVLLISKKDGTLATLSLNKPNIFIGTDSNGEVVLYDRSEVE